MRPASNTRDAHVRSARQKRERCAAQQKRCRFPPVAAILTALDMTAEGSGMTAVASLGAVLDHLSEPQSEVEAPHSGGRFWSAAELCRCLHLQGYRPWVIMSMPVAIISR